MLFPRENEFNKEVLAASQATGVPVSVIKGFIGLESAFNPNAYREEKHISDASYGLMQILYKTAKGVGYAGEPKGLLAPAASILYGAKFLRGLLQRYPNVLDAIASYNMGHPRKASATTPTIVGIYGKPGPDWVYANQPYVDRVASYIAYYQALEKADASRAAVVLDLIKKKITPKAALYLDLSSLHSLPEQKPKPENGAAS
jgi:soluble lytic murein transglycosylase-like protein